MAEIVELRYRAFLSYAHADTSWAKWLHGRLEAFRIDRDLAGRATSLGVVPASLRPVFRDRDDFPGGHSLAEATLAALDASGALIVLCSPDAAQSKFVNEEVRLFRWRHPERPVIPVIIEGAYPDDFPPALRNEINADGTISDRSVDLLGPDLREQADGRELGLAKIVAGMIGVGSDEIYQRSERGRRRSARFRNGVIAVLGFLALAAAGSAAYAWQQLRTNEAFLDATLERFTSLVDRAVKTGEAYSLPLNVTLGFLEEAEGMLNVMSRYGQETPKLKYRKAVMLSAFADNYRDLGQTTTWQSRIGEAQRVMADLSRDYPLNKDFAFTSSGIHDSAGDLQRTKGDLVAAMREYRAAFGIRSRLATAEPDNAAWQLALARSHDLIGSISLSEGNPAAALAHFRAGFEITQRLVKLDPGNVDVQRSLSAAHGGIGKALMMLGDFSGALDTQRAARAIDERLARAAPDNARRQSGVSATDMQIGALMNMLGDSKEALKSFRASQVILERLAKADPNNTSWTNDLAMSHWTIAAVQNSVGDQAAALESARAAHAIWERLAKADPDNADWQWFLGAADFLVGDLLVEQGQVPQALESHRAAAAIMNRLARRDPNNSLYKLALSLVRANIGDLLKSQGDLSEALESYRGSLVIAEQLVGANASVVPFEDNLATAYNKVGDALLAQSKLPDALESYRAALAVRERLANAKPEHTESQSKVAAALNNIGDVLKEQGKVAEALETYRASLAKVDPIARASPDSTDRQQELILALGNICVTTGEHGQFDVGLADCERALEVARILTRLAPDRTDYKKLLIDLETLLPNYRIETARALIPVAWDALMAGEPAKALTAAERSLSLAPGHLTAETNRVHALMYLGRAQEARALYLAHKDKLLPDNNNQSWQQAITEDFAELRKAGRAHPQMAEIETAFKVGAQARKQCSEQHLSSKQQECRRR
jgi:tetratricopeptide (TPR) repeat protein